MGKASHPPARSVTGKVGEFLPMHGLRLISESAPWSCRIGHRQWARTGSNRRPLVCKIEPDRPPRFTRCHSVLERPAQRLGSCPLCPRIVELCLPVLAHSWHNGGLVVRCSAASAWRTSLFDARTHDPPTCGGLEPLTPTARVKPDVQARITSSSSYRFIHVGERFPCRSVQSVFAGNPES
jgi:hypothetical protein